MRSRITTSVFRWNRLQRVGCRDEEDLREVDRNTEVVILERMVLLLMKCDYLRAIR
jgi:hypothetical protein